MDRPTLVKALFGTNHDYGRGYRLVLSGVLGTDTYELTSRPGEVPQYTRNGVPIDLSEYHGFVGHADLDDPYAFVFPKDTVETSSYLSITSVATIVSTEDLVLEFHPGSSVCYILRDGHKRPSDPSHKYVDVALGRLDLAAKYDAKIKAAGLQMHQMVPWSIATLRPMSY